MVNKFLVTTFSVFPYLIIVIIFIFFFSAMISIYIAGGLTMQPYLLKSKLITIITSSSNTF